jgi:hypothetical protein
LAGVKPVGTKPPDGISVAPLLLGTAKDWPERMLFQHQAGRVSVRTERYRLDHQGLLFDMIADPGQERDITEQQPEVAGRLLKAVAAWKDDVLPGIAKDERPFPVGHADFPITTLPARDGVPAGGVQRSARAPNCSFFTNWLNTKDRITWNIAVETAGEYDVTLYYTCSQEAVGSVVELSFLNERVTGKVAEPHDPPLVGAKFDRVPREGESYVKDFRPLRLGVLRLETGRGLLTLRALEVPGPQVMDLRAVELTLRK